MDVCPCCTVYYRQTTCQPVTTEVDFEKEHPSQALALPFLMLLIAGIINAIGVTLFIAPVQLYDSGISGTSILLSQLTPDYLSLSFFLILLNIPLLLFGFKRQGATFSIYAIFTVCVYSVAAWLITDVLPIDVSIASPLAGTDLFLCALFGGIISGVGSGLASATAARWTALRSSPSSLQSRSGCPSVHLC